MRAIIQSRYGDPREVLLLGDLQVPTPGPDQVLVRVHATSVNTPDRIGATGTPLVLRPLMVGLNGPRSRVRGSDLAGVVEAVGNQVTAFAPGDAVFGSTWVASGFAPDAQGTFCEYAVAPSAQLAHKPRNLTFAQAAAAVMSGVTALQALRDVARVTPGDQVLVNGASGGLGTFAVQLAKAMGAEVTGVCSSRNIELVRSLGADHVIDYSHDDYTTGDARYDVILDNVLNRPPAETARVLAPGGRFILNSVGPNRWVGSLPQLAMVGLRKPAGWSTVEFHPSRQNLDALAAYLEAGTVRVVIDRSYPLDQAGAAVAHLASSRARGKIVIDVGDAGPGPTATR